MGAQQKGPRRDGQSPWEERKEIGVDGAGEGDEWRRGRGHLSCARVSIASWRMELERESSGSSWICLWTGDNREINDGVRQLQTTKAKASPCLRKQAAAAPQPGQTIPTAIPCWGRQLTAQTCPEHPEHSVQGHQKHSMPSLAAPHTWDSARTASTAL